MKSWRRSRNWNRARIELGRQEFRNGFPAFLFSLLKLSVLNSQVRQGVADAVDDLDELGMRLLKAVHRRTQALERMFERFGVLLRARGFVRGGLREVGD